MFKTMRLKKVYLNKPLKKLDVKANYYRKKTDKYHLEPVMIFSLVVLKKRTLILLKSDGTTKNQRLI